MKVSLSGKKVVVHQSALKLFHLKTTGGVLGTVFNSNVGACAPSVPFFVTEEALPSLVAALAAVPSEKRPSDVRVVVLAASGDAHASVDQCSSLRIEAVVPRDNSTIFAEHVHRYSCKF